MMFPQYCGRQNNATYLLFPFKIFFHFLLNRFSHQELYKCNGAGIARSYTFPSVLAHVVHRIYRGIKTHHITGRIFYHVVFDALVPFSWPLSTTILIFPPKGLPVTVTVQYCHLRGAEKGLEDNRMIVIKASMQHSRNRLFLFFI